MRNTFIDNYFGFNRQQRNGLWVLIAISFTLLIVRLAYPYFIVPEKITVLNLPLVERRLDSAYAAPGRLRESRYSSYKKHELFVFDPNTVSAAQLQQLGFREKTITTFLKFRSKGFVFRKKEDLQKVYGISEKFYAMLEPYILLKEQPPLRKETAVAEKAAAPVPAAKKVIAKAELNSADSLALLELNGIGPAFAKRILKYRSLLGGFVSIEQLKEVYGFSGELYEKVSPFLKLDLALIKKINLNTDDFKTINKHPYLSYEITRVIFDRRRQGAVTAAHLKEMLNDEALYNKLLPYLAFD